jgi:glutaredoxin-like protein NrdH
MSKNNFQLIVSSTVTAAPESFWGPPVVNEEIAMPPCHVELYALSTCSHCKDTKDLLNQCGINYDCVDVDRLDPEKRRTILEEIKKVNPECTFPTLVAGEKVIIGFKEAEIKEALGIP